jgi:ClpP class serine protease
VNTGVKVSTSIDNNDDLPFSEMISTIPGDQKAIDVILVTPGGSAQQVAKFVNKLRPRFDNVVFILPYMAMSAGTIFAMSGNDIVMGKNSYIGPIDPQVPNREGFYVLAQAILTLIDVIRERGEGQLKRGQSPPWTDLQTNIIGPHGRFKTI